MVSHSILILLCFSVAISLHLHFAMSAKRKFITLEDRVKNLELVCKGDSVRAIAAMCSCGWTQIQNIIYKDKAIMLEYRLD